MSKQAEAAAQAAQGIDAKGDMKAEQSDGYEPKRRCVMKRVMAVSVVFAVALVLATSGMALADTIALWDYNSYTSDNSTSSTFQGTPQNPAPSSGSGTQAQVATPTGWGYNNGGFPSTTTWAGDYPADPAVHNDDIRYRIATNTVDEGLRWNVPTGGYTDIQVSLGLFSGQTLTNRTFSFEYTTDGTTWSTNSVSYSGSSTWLPLSLDLASVPSADNNANFAIRLLADQSANTTFSVDYVKFDGTPVPIPAAAWLLGSGLIGLVAVRRRRMKKM
jgi:hypothetical protein